jgi:hypothetical protein
MESSAIGEHATATEESFQVSLMIAEAGKGHNIVEHLIKPAAKTMTNIMLGERYARALKKFLCLMTQLNAA